MFGIARRAGQAVERHRLVAHHASALVHAGRVQPARIEVGLGTRDKEGVGLMHRVQACKVKVAPIHDIEGPGLDGQDIQNVDIVHLAVANVNEAGDAAAQIQQRVQLDGPLVERNGAQSNRLRHRSIVLESSA